MSKIITLYDLNTVNPDSHKVMRGLQPDGWYPLDIEYSFNFDAGVECLVWRIIGTEHTFKIQADIIDKIHGDNIRDHFLKTLERFALHYKNYQEYGYSDDWKEKYKKEYGDRIIS